jgi:NADP-reducing hydrogenase subunit HndB
MGKMTLEELRKLREQKKGEMSQRDMDGKTVQLIVGMGTCGIAAGAKDTFDALIKALEAAKIADQVSVRQTGCMGLCYVEPTVEVLAPGLPTVIYGKVDAACAKEIVEKHILGKTLLDNHIYDRPAADIIKK